MFPRSLDFLVSTIQLQIPWDRVYASAANDGTDHITTFKVTAVQIGGFFTTPILLPYDYDRTRPGHLYATIARTTGPSGVGNGNMSLKTDLTVALGDGTVLTQNLAQVVAIPLDWPAKSLMLVELLNGTDPVFAARYLPDPCWIGARVYRDGTDALDTFTASLSLLGTVALDYTRLCAFWGCG